VIIYPAMDLKGGRCVRLLQGDMDTATIFSEDPAAVARAFEEKGAEWLHVVDLDGAFAGSFVNRDAILSIVRAVNIPIQLGGGLRNMEHLDTVINKIGISRAILGTAALEDQDFLREAVKLYGSHIAVGIDERNGRVAVRGWAEETDTSALELAMKVKDIGVKTVIHTDISRDGMLSGPNFEVAEGLIQAAGLDVIVSGGVAELAHVIRCREIGATGAILGRALYTGAIKLEEAIAAGEEPC